MCIKIQDVHSSEEEKDPGSSTVASLNKGNFTCICIGSGNFIK